MWWTLHTLAERQQRSVACWIYRKQMARRCKSVAWRGDRGVDAEGEGAEYGSTNFIQKMGCFFLKLWLYKWRCRRRRGYCGTRVSPPLRNVRGCSIQQWRPAYGVAAAAAATVEGGGATGDDDDSSPFVCWVCWITYIVCWRSDRICCCSW